MMEELTLKEKITYSLIGVTILGGSFFVGRSLIRKAKVSSEEKKTFEEGAPATFAKQIKMAFENDAPFGWGTDEEALRKIFSSIQSKEEFKKIILSYSRLYGRNMMADMKEELSSSEYSEMLSIIAAKPDSGYAATSIEGSNQQFEAWAKRLKSAFEKTYLFLPGTDEDAIKTVFLEGSDYL